MEEEKAILERYLREKGLKATVARETVLKAFLSIESHVTAEAVYDAARSLDPGIGQATVFRSMKLFTEAGLAREAHRDDGGRQYEHAWRHAHHDHLRCVRCGAVVEFLDPAIEAAIEATYRLYGYEPAGHSLELNGVCKSCRAAQGPANKDSPA